MKCHVSLSTSHRVLRTGSRPVSTKSWEEPAKFSRAKQGDFVQDPPRHENPFRSDLFLQRCLKRMIDPDLYRTEVEPDLDRFGERVAKEIWDLGRRCELEPPYLKPSPWGTRENSDTLVTSAAWKRQKAISAEEGLIALAYNPIGATKGCQYRRIHQVAKLFMYSASSGLFSCPLAMTDGAAAILTATKRHQEAVSRLTSRDPGKFWTSGQWMTEKRGGSDVANGTQTLAVHVEGDRYKLYGYKWFSSATDSDMALTLARIVDGDTGKVIPGTAGVSMFYLETRVTNGPDQKLNNIEITKLKNKMGTRQLPTAELLLDGTDATLLSEPGRGIASIAPMLTVTRMHNVLASVSAQRKILQLARDYAQRRQAFNQPVSNHPLHLNTLLTLETNVRGCTIFMLELARLMGLVEAGAAGEQDIMVLRLMMPVAKAFTAKHAMQNISEGLECFGGQGYIEDTGIPALLRDTQVLPIWEGTTNIMALDLFRAVVKTEGQALSHLFERIKNGATVEMENEFLQDSSNKVLTGLDKLTTCINGDASTLSEVKLRDFMFSLANLYVGCLMIEHSCDTSSDSDICVTHQWTTRRDLVPFVTNLPYFVTDNKAMQNIVYEGYSPDETFNSKFSP